MSLDLFEILFRIAIIYLFIAFGNSLRFFSNDPDNSPAIKFLTKIILNFFFPFLVISSILNVSSSSLFVVLFSIFFAFVIIFSGMLGVFLYSRFRSIPRPTLGSLFLTVSFPNSVFLPFPLILLLIGPTGLISATLFAVTIIFFQNSVGSYIALTFGNPVIAHSSLSASSLFKKIFFFPPTLSMIIGFLLKVFFHPSSFSSLFSFLPFSAIQISSFVDTISWFSLIFALLLVGLTFNLSFSSFKNRFLLQATFYRLIIAPSFGIVFLLFLYVFFPSSDFLQPVFILPLLIQAFAGPAIINIAFAKEFSLDVDSQSLYITFITLLSLFLLPILVLVTFSLL